MPFKKVILHVGPGKTGSTSIQFALNENRKLLLKNGVSYPLGNAHEIKHEFFSSCFSLESDECQVNEATTHSDVYSLREQKDIYIRSLEKSLSGIQADTLVLSDEGMVHLTVNALEKMKRFLERYCEQFEIVFYIRPPLSHGISAMSQRVKSGRRAYEDNGAVPFVNYQYLLNKLCQVFTKKQINIRLFSKESLPNGNVVVDFLSLLDLPENTKDEVTIKKRAMNISLSHEALLIGDKMLEILDDHMPLEKLEWKRKVGPVLSRSIKGRRIQLTPLQQETVLNDVAPQLEYLFNEFGFSMENPALTEYEPVKISNDTINVTARALLRVFVTDFKLPIEYSTKKKKELNSFYILSTLLTVKSYSIIIAAYHRFKSVQHWFIQKTNNT